MCDSVCGDTGGVEGDGEQIPNVLKTAMNKGQGFKQATTVILTMSTAVPRPRVSTAVLNPKD